ncbi:acetoin catabolism protein X [Burkholderia ubonensis]|nr:acetoin catabolism protein X [Burkholderia ubonensis]RQP97678.1 acetoin catabolism protein X [Burkholderia ubonensis]
MRRVVANANSVQLADRVNIVLRAMAALGACGVTRVLMMPDREGLKPMLERHLARVRAAATGSHAWPQLEWLAMPTTARVDDTFRAARLMREAGVAAIVVLGGDGTHRAVVRECGQVPIAGLSTGTNNAYPELREATLVGLAVGLYTVGRIPSDAALVFNKRLDVTLNAASGAVRHDIALVDAAIAHEHYIGAKALWRTDSLAAVYLAFADPEAIGLSSIGGLLAPVGRREPGGLHVELTPPEPDDPATGTTAEPLFHLHAPIAPGLLQPVPVSGWHRMVDGEPVRVRQHAGVVAVDGEREITFGPRDCLTITLRERAFRSVAVAGCLRYAATHGLLRGSPGTALGAQANMACESAGAAPLPFPSPL